MTGSSIPQWAPRVAKEKIQRLYTSDANGLVDEDLIDEVGWALWSRCDSILSVTQAHYGRVPCPGCGAIIEHASLSAALNEPRISPWKDEDVLHCEACDWHLPWKTYHQAYRGKQLFGANAVDVFKAYHASFPRAVEPAHKMLLIDQLIHAFHTGLVEPGRPVGANLIAGSLKDVILFLDGLTNGQGSAAGIGNSHDTWRQMLESASWTGPFISPRDNPG